MFVKFQWNIKCSLFIKHLLVVTCFIVVLALMAFFFTFIFECIVCCGDEKAKCSVHMVCVVIIILHFFSSMGNDGSMSLIESHIMGVI